MNTNQYTQKSLEAIDRAQKMALENNNMQIEQEHLFYALLDQDGGLIPQLFMKMDVDTDDFLADLDQLIGKIPQVSGPGREPGKIYISPVVDKTFLAAKKEAEKMNDEYISVEHLMLGVLMSPADGVKDVLQRYGIDVGSFCERCNQCAAAIVLPATRRKIPTKRSKIRVRFGGESSGTKVGSCNRQR